MAKVQLIPAGTSAGPFGSASGAERVHCRGKQPSTTRCHPTCLKLPFFLCSQSIMSWKMGIMIFRTSGCGTSVTPRKGPIIPGIKWILCSPEQQNQQVLVYACSAPSRELPKQGHSTWLDLHWKHLRTKQALPNGFLRYSHSWLFGVHG